MGRQVPETASRGDETARGDPGEQNVTPLRSYRSTIPEDGVHVLAKRTLLGRRYIPRKQAHVPMCTRNPLDCEYFNRRGVHGSEARPPTMASSQVVGIRPFVRLEQWLVARKMPWRVQELGSRRIPTVPFFTRLFVDAPSRSVCQTCVPSQCLNATFVYWLADVKVSCNRIDAISIKTDQRNDRHRVGMRFPFVGFSLPTRFFFRACFPSTPSVPDLHIDASIVGRLVGCVIVRSCTHPTRVPEVSSRPLSHQVRFGGTLRSRIHAPLGVPPFQNTDHEGLVCCWMCAQGRCFLFFFLTRLK